MTSAKEKGRFGRSSPIPNSVLVDDPDFTKNLLLFQAKHLAATFGMLPETASAVAILAFYHRGAA